jgi:hypothetical protein
VPQFRRRVGKYRWTLYENNFKTLPGKCALEIRFPLCGRNDLDSVAEIIVAADPEPAPI